MKKIWKDNELIFDLELRYHPEIKSQYAVTDRHKYLHPDVPELPDWLANNLSDCFRYGKGSYLARLRKGNKVSVARPGNSGHNWGISIDVDLKAVKKELAPKDNWKDFINNLRHQLAYYGFFHITNEEWHFNFMGLQGNAFSFSDIASNFDSRPLYDYNAKKAIQIANHHPWKAVRSRVSELVNPQLFSQPSHLLNDKELQGALVRASHILHDERIHPGPVDGIYGRKTRRAVDRFRTVIGSTTGDSWIRALISVVAVPNEKEI